MTPRQIAQRTFAGLAAGVLVGGSAVLVATLLFVHPQDVSVVNTVYFEIYPLFVLIGWACTIVIMLLRYRVLKVLLLVLLWLLIGLIGYVLLTVLLGVLGVVTGDGITNETVPIRGGESILGHLTHQ